MNSTTNKKFRSTSRTNETTSSPIKKTNLAKTQMIGNGIY